jgi:hypothetical protein
MWAADGSAMRKTARPPAVPPLFSAVFVILMQELQRWHYRGIQFPPNVDENHMSETYHKPP